MSQEQTCPLVHREGAFHAPFFVPPFYHGRQIGDFEVDDPLMAGGSDEAFYLVGVNMPVSDEIGVKVPEEAQHGPIEELVFSFIGVSGLVIFHPFEVRSDDLLDRVIGFWHNAERFFQFEFKNICLRFGTIIHFPNSRALPAVLVDVDLIFSLCKFSNAHCRIHFEDIALPICSSYRLKGGKP
jgi:hypothetical protein